MWSDSDSCEELIGYARATPMAPIQVVPVGDNWQIQKAAFMGVPETAILKRHTQTLVTIDQKVPCKWPRTGTRLAKQDGDGNCFFRCLSYAVCGHPEYHMLMREKITKYLHENWTRYQPLAVERYFELQKLTPPATHQHTFFTYEDYQRVARIELPGEWAADPEISAAAHYLNTHILCVTVGKGWRPYPGVIPIHDPVNCKWIQRGKIFPGDTAILLQHSGIYFHFDYVEQYDG